MIGFDEYLGTATYDKVEETPATAAAVVIQLPLMNRKQTGAADQQNMGCVIVELTTRHELDTI